MVIELPVFLKRKSCAKPKEFRRTVDCPIKWELLKSVKGVMMNKILQRCLRRQKMTKSVNGFVLVEGGNTGPLTLNVRYHPDTVEIPE